MLSTGNSGPNGTRKPRRRSGSRIAQDEHADRDQNKGKERADVGEVGQGADVEEAGGNGHHESRDPGGKGRGAEDWDGRR